MSTLLSLLGHKIRSELVALYQNCRIMFISLWYFNVSIKVYKTFFSYRLTTNIAKRLDLTVYNFFQTAVKLRYS